MSTVLVTGASGFLGSALIPALLSDGLQVIGIDRNKGGFLDRKTLDHKRFRFISFDITRDFSKVLSGANIHTICHLASLQPGRPGISYQDFYAGNVKTTENVVTYAKNASVRAIVYTSTISLMRPAGAKKCLDENSPVEPDNYYTLTKYIAEKTLQIGLAGSKSALIVLRFPSLFGKNHLGGLIYTYYDLAKKGADISLFHQGRPRRNLLYVSDAVDSLRKALSLHERPEKMSVFVIGSRDSISTFTIARKMKKLIYSPSRIVLAGKVPGKKFDICIDISKAKRLLDFHPMSVNVGLQCFIKELGYEL